MTHLRKMMLEELQRRNYSENTTRYYLRTVEDFARRFNRPPDRLGPRHIREYQAELFQKRKLSPGTVTNTPRGSAVFLHQDSQEGLEHRRDSLSEKSTSPSDDPEPGRSRATHRCGAHSLPSHSADDALRHRSAERRVDAPESQRHRQQADGDSHSRRQGTHRPRCDAQPKTARGTARALAPLAEQSPAHGCFQATAGTTVISPSIRKHLGTPARKPPSERASRKTSIPTPCVTALPLIFSKRARICAPFRSC